MASGYDYPLLFYGSATEAQVEKSEHFYLSIYHGSTTIKALLHGAMGIAVLGMAAKLHRWSDNDKYFGTCSIVLYVAALCMYAAVTVPNIRALAEPDNPAYVNRSVYDAPKFRMVENYEFQPLSIKERYSLCQVIGATNVIVAALLAGVLLMQGGEWYAIRQDRLAANRRRQESIAQLDAQRSGKKVA